MKLVPAFLLVGLLVGSVAAAQPCPTVLPPVNGIYLPMEQSGPMLSGRFAESWVDPGGHGQVGNTINAASWSSPLLGGQWRLWCPQIAAPPTLVADTRDGSGTGDVTWRTTYSGGQFWLTRFGPWSADNLADFTGTVQSFIVTTTYQYVFGSVLGIRSNIVTIGMFDQLDPCWGSQCFDYTIDNTSFYGTTDEAPKPADFPGFLDPNFCPSDQERLTRGGWGDVTHVALRITGCVVPDQPTTWGGIKTL
jgi:hypothetical protein